MLPLQKVYLEAARKGITPAEIANVAGWYLPDGKADGMRVLRKLGLKPFQSNGKYYSNKRVHLDIAVKLLEGMRLDPVDLKI